MAQAKFHHHHTSRLEGYHCKQSAIHQWTPRLKLVSLGLLMFAFAAVKHLSLVPAMLLITGALYSLSKLPFSFWLKRFRYPGLFIAAVVALLPLLSGETVVAQWGPLAVRQEGLIATGLVTGRFSCILTLGFILLGTTPFVTLLRALRSLGLPTLISDMTLLTYRYLFETAEMLSTMQQSMKLRGFSHHRKRSCVITQLVGLLGTLLVRSYERSERVYKAMLLRGYGQMKRADLTQPIDRLSIGLTAGAISIAVGFLIAEILL